MSTLANKTPAGNGRPNTSSAAGNTTGSSAKRRTRRRPDTKKMLSREPRPGEQQPPSEFTTAQIEERFGASGEGSESPAPLSPEAMKAQLFGGAENESAEQTAATVDPSTADEIDTANEARAPAAVVEPVEELELADAGDADAEPVEPAAAADDGYSQYLFDNNSDDSDGSPATVAPSSSSSEALDELNISIEVAPVGEADAAIVSVFQHDKPVVEDKINIAVAKRRSELAAAIAEKTGAPAELLEQVLLERSIACRQRRVKQADAESPAEPTREELLSEMDPAVVEAAHEMLRDPRLIFRILDDIATLGVTGERGLVATLFLVGVSRLLDDTLSSIIRAASSTGKSFAQNCTAATFPPEALVLATSMTPTALQYAPKDSLRHKWIVAGERSRVEDDKTAEATRLLRELQSAGSISRLVTITSDGPPHTIRVEQRGPIAFSETTTLTKIFNEDLNRCLLLSADERESQSRAVVQRIAADRSGAVPPVDRDAIIQRSWAMHRLLEQLPVVVPFGPQLAEKFPVDRVESRRGIGQLLSLIQAHALLYQYQRERDGDGRIIATITDYRAVRPLAVLPFSYLLKNRVSEAAIRFHQRFAPWAGSRAWTPIQIAGRDNNSKRAISEWLRELADVGAVEPITISRGNIPATWELRVADTAKLQGMGVRLPQPEELR